MARIRVDLTDRGYEVVVQKGILDNAGPEMAAVCRGRTALVVTEPAVGALYLPRVISSLGDAGFRTSEAVIAGGETNKTLASVAGLYEELLDAHMDRTGVLVTLGGGVIGDMGGFAAATYLRGIDFVQIPTTLLAQVDAGIGGKVGVDLPRGKNLVGAFYQPKCVLIDPNVLTTLPRREFASGLAEMIKHGIIAGHELFDFMRSQTDALWNMDGDVLEAAIARSCEVKANIVTRDERESGLRALLNYGHTVGHGVEVATGFAKYTHGEAVAIGMVTSALVSEEKGLAEPGLAGCIADALVAARLPVAPDSSVDADEVVQAMAYDKKVMFGNLRFVLPKRIGEVCVSEDVTPADVRSALVEQVRLFG